MALVTALWWLTGTLAVLTLTFQWMQFRGRIERRIAGAADLLDAAELVLAHEVARLKARPWERRWYATGSGAISGTLADVDYSGFTQDVAPFWSSAIVTAPLDGHTDIIMRVARGAGAERATACFFARLVFRRPSPERPTMLHVRRLARLPELDPASAPDRAGAVARLNAAERRREANRPSAQVLAREVAAVAHREPTFTLRQVRASLALSGLQPQVDAEARELAALRSVRRYHSSPASAPTTTVPGHGRYFYAMEQARLALAVARTRADPHARAAIPRALFAVARAETLLARTHPHVPPCGGSSLCERHARLALAAAAVDELTGNYPWDPDPTSPTFAPERFEAPHGFVARAFGALAGARLGDATDETAARDEARSWLRRLRERYPGFRLFDEGASTGAAHGSEAPSDPADEAAWYLEQLANRPLLAIGGESIRHELASARIFRWAPGEVEGTGAWIDEARLTAGRTDHAVAALRATAATAGRALGERFLIVGGRDYAGNAVTPDAEIYDPYARELHAIPGALARPRSAHGAAQLDDGRVVIAGGDDATRPPGIVVLESEVFDPVSETFETTTGTLNNPRSASVTVRMTNGTLVTQGDDTAELMAATGGSWLPACNRLTQRRMHAQTCALRNAALLVAGGAAAGATPSSTAAVLFTTGTAHFDPGAGACTAPTGVVTVTSLEPRWYGFAARVADGTGAGRVLIGGGVSGLLVETRASAAGIGYVRKLEMVDPGDGTVTDLGDSNAVGGGRRAAALPGAAFVIVNGRPNGAARSADGMNELYVWDPDPGKRRRRDLPGFPDGIDLTVPGNFE